MPQRDRETAWGLADWLGVDMAEDICAVEGCEKDAFRRGWCAMHWQRWRRHGDVGPAEKGAPPGRPKNWCSVEGCDRKHYGKGYCSMHYQRWVKFGDADVVMPNGMWLGGDAGYSAVHERLVRSRGRAREHPCAHCGQPAADWAYDGTCSNEKVGQRHGYPLAYSTDPERYMPLCRACHSQHDDNAPRNRGAVTT